MDLLSFATELRSLARRAGVTRFIQSIRPVTRSEDKFDHALLGVVRPGDCVWDIGANVGLFTSRLSALVGPDGSVCAFEPAPSCSQHLRELKLPNVTVFEAALSNLNGSMPFGVDGDPLATTHSLDCSQGERTMPVEVATGDSLVSSGRASPPNIIKVDVEGFELEVLQGLESVLRSRACRAVLIEVHFQQLEHRGLRQAPSQIKRLLQSVGFTIRWLDASHLVANRQAHGR
jgi:FkbM family methyltransferase